MVTLTFSAPQCKLKDLFTTDKDKCSNKNIEQCNYDDDCVWSILNDNSYFYIRSNKIKFLFSKLHSFTGPYFRFIVIQIVSMFIIYFLLKIILVKYPLKSFLYLKFFIYMLIINFTVFYVNNMIKEFNIFNLRNMLYGNSNICLISSSESSDFSNIYGNAINYLNKKTPEECVNYGKNKSSHWRDLYLYSDYEYLKTDTTGTKFIDPSDDKIKSINNIGYIVSIYSILYFVLIFVCDFLSFVKEINLLKYVSIFVLILVIGIYVLFKNNNKYINNIQNLKYDDTKPELKSSDFFSNYSIYEDISNSYFNNEILINILIITIIYTIIFSTHKFYD